MGSGVGQGTCYSLGVCRPSCRRPHVLTWPLALTRARPILSLYRRPSRRPLCPGSQTQPSSRAPTRNALTHQARAKARWAVWTWWMSQATYRAISTRAPMTRRCRVASSHPRSSPSRWGPCHLTLHYIPLLPGEELKGTVGVAVRPPPAWGLACFSLTPKWGPEITDRF